MRLLLIGFSALLLAGCGSSSTAVNENGPQNGMQFMQSQTGEKFLSGYRESKIRTAPVGGHVNNRAAPAKQLSVCAINVLQNSSNTSSASGMFGNAVSNAPANVLRHISDDGKSVSVEGAVKYFSHASVIPVPEFAKYTLQITQVDMDNVSFAFSNIERLQTDGMMLGFMSNKYSDKSQDTQVVVAELNKEIDKVMNCLSS